MVEQAAKIVGGAPAALPQRSMCLGRHAGHQRKQVAHFLRVVGEAVGKTEALALCHDTLAANTRAQLRQVFEAIRALTSPPESKLRPIGFITPN